MQQHNWIQGCSQESQQAPQPKRLDNPYFDPNTLEASATAISERAFVPQSPKAIREFEELRDEIDPIIERFISLGVCNEF